MSQFEKVSQQIEEVKKCSPADLSKHFEIIFILFPLLSKGEKKEIASTFYQWAEEHAEKEPRKFAFAIYLLALSEFFNEELESTLLHVTDARKYFTEHNEPDEIAVCASAAGGIIRTFGNLDLALKELWEAYRQLKKSGKYIHNLMVCLYQIGSIYLEMNNYEEAHPVFTDLLECSERLHNDMMVMNALQGLGKVYLSEKKYDDALRTLEKGLGIAERLNSLMHIPIFNTELAIYYTETKDYSRAIELHKKALEFRELHKYIGGTVTNCIRLGDLYTQQSETDEAISILNKGMALAEQLKLKPKIYEIHRLLSEVYQQKNELDKSLEHYRLFHKIREEVETEDNVKKIKNLKLVFEAEQTLKENVIIKRQKAEIEQKNIELQETIDELTLSKINRKAKALTLIIAITLFFAEDLLLDFVLHRLPEDNFILSFGAKLLIVFSLKPIEHGVEHYLLKRVIRKKKREVLA